uniref:Serpentine receptor class gamma n=1 Tax=Meloidogyne incognita TaxID=6306 RepID=A0A914M4K3_MELIC
MIGYFSTFLMMYSLSFDRLLAVAFPFLQKSSDDLKAKTVGQRDGRYIVVAQLFNYQSVKRHYYICVHLTVVITFICFIIYRIIQVIILYPEWPVNGSIGDTLSLITLNSSIWAFISSPLSMLPSIIPYLIIGLIVKCLKVSSNDNKKSKLWRSLFLIVFVDIGGYFINFSIMMFILAPIKCDNPIRFLSLVIFPGLFLNLAIMSTAPILFINSTDYNKAYRKEFNKIKVIIRKMLGIKVHPTIQVKPCSNIIAGINIESVC